jgi:hypothetical protein
LVPFIPNWVDFHEFGNHDFIDACNEVIHALLPLLSQHINGPNDLAREFSGDEEAETTLDCFGQINVLAYHIANKTGHQAPL